MMKETTGKFLVVLRLDPYSSDPIELYAVLEAPHPTTLVSADYRAAERWAVEDELRAAKEAAAEEGEELELEGDPADPAGVYCDQMGIRFDVIGATMLTLGDWHPAYIKKER